MTTKYTRPFLLQYRIVFIYISLFSNNIIDDDDKLLLDNYYQYFCNSIFFNFIAYGSMDSKKKKENEGVNE